MGMDGRTCGYGLGDSLVEGPWEGRES
jgi:hypothetical protein